MISPAKLGLFFAVVFGVILLPGLDMAFVLGSALAGGRRRGLAAVSGIIAGGICHVGMTATGIGMLLKVVPGAFNALLLGGGLYIGWIGLSLMRGGADFSLNPQVEARSRAATFRQGVLTSLLNPKAYLFMLAVFPQFLRPELGAIWAQSLVLWLIIALNQLGVYGGLAVAADRARRWMQGRPGAGALAARWVGGLLMAAALLTVLEGWRRI
ncbi:threonine transporter RhtB [Geothrix limicola]|uniref:Threonine transporter RhtB n=1 Tax=Geothrix limicola TaxID=2927978 RepID=A0ABQ5QF73_9BACT|nr:LysE family translocator [Geothrix limicola]GLH72815.1 threonine transporter RhtB [Geothrix limicola]